MCTQVHATCTSMVAMIMCDLSCVHLASDSCSVNQKSMTNDITFFMDLLLPIYSSFTSRHSACLFVLYNLIKKNNKKKNRINLEQQAKQTLTALFNNSLDFNLYPIELFLLQVAC